MAAVAGDGSGQEVIPGDGQLMPAPARTGQVRTATGALPA
jgi:hypothetical protein